MKLKRLIGVYDEITQSYLENELAKKKIRYVIQSDLEGPSGGICYVQEDDFEKSVEILKNSTIEFADLNSEALPIIKKIRKNTKKYPVIGKMTFPSRIIILIMLILFTIFSILLLNLGTVTKDELINNRWCLNQIKPHNGFEIKLPNSKPTLMIEKDCINKLKFTENSFKLSSLTTGTWKYLKKNKIQLIDDSNEYNGIYTIERQFTNETLQLKSENYIIQIEKNILRGSKIIFNLD